MARMFVCDYEAVVVVIQVAVENNYLIEKDTF